jgi:transposase
MEATGSHYRRVQQHLQAAEVSLGVLNPAQVSHFAKSHYRRNKTGQADALLLAMYAKERSGAPTLRTSL